MTRQPTQAAIARELGISKAAVTKLKARGMPTHSADAARAWRAAHLCSGRVRPDPGPSPETLVARVHNLAALALQAAHAGRFDLVADELRTAMRAVPAERRSDVSLPVELWRALIGRHALGVLDSGPKAEQPMSADDADDADAVGAVCFALACGEAALL